MIAREWKARCLHNQKEGFIKYLFQTGVKDTSSTKGFKDAQILSRDLKDKVEITLITYWDCLESIKAYAGDDIEVARLYPEDFIYELEPDDFVIHYEVIKANASEMEP
ncbi:MAG: antibiotic biosynthesis monooxygenase [Deltaproteobacteria bacterium]|nr:antibiotic biosynthesis monooxygenase [Deltaproteobacteria bacterium]